MMSKRRPKAASFSSRVCPPTGEVSVGRCMASVCGMGPKLRGTFGLVTRRPIQISSGLILGALLWGARCPMSTLLWSSRAGRDHRAQWSASYRCRISGAAPLGHPRAHRRACPAAWTLSWSSPALGFWAASPSPAPLGPFCDRHRGWEQPEHIGTQVAALSHVDLALHGRLVIAGWGADLGWTQKTWGLSLTAPGRERVVIGSAINGAAQLGDGPLARPPMPPLGTGTSGFSVRLDHQSNASFKQPNLGTNVVSLGTSVLSLLRARLSPESCQGSHQGRSPTVLPAPTTGGYLFLGMWAAASLRPLADQENVHRMRLRIPFRGPCPESAMSRVAC